MIIPPYASLSEHTGCALTAENTRVCVSVRAKPSRDGITEREHSPRLLDSALRDVIAVQSDIALAGESADEPPANKRALEDRLVLAAIALLSRLEARKHLVVALRGLAVTVALLDSTRQRHHRRGRTGARGRDGAGAIGRGTGGKTRTAASATVKAEEDSEAPGCEGPRRTVLMLAGNQGVGGRGRGRGGEGRELAEREDPGRDYATPCVIDYATRHCVVDGVPRYMVDCGGDVVRDAVGPVVVPGSQGVGHDRRGRNKEADRRGDDECREPCERERGEERELGEHCCDMWCGCGGV